MIYDSAEEPGIDTTIGSTRDDKLLFPSPGVKRHACGALAPPATGPRAKC